MFKIRWPISSYFKKSFKNRKYTFSVSKNLWKQELEKLRNGFHQSNILKEDWEALCVAMNEDKLIQYLNNNDDGRLSLSDMNKILYYIKILSAAKKVTEKTGSLEHFKSKHLKKKKFYSEAIGGALLTFVSAVAIVVGALGLCSIVIPGVGLISATASFAVLGAGVIGFTAGTGLFTHGLFGLRCRRVQIVGAFAKTVEEKCQQQQLQRYVQK